MPEFLFTATDSAGNRVQGKATADDMSAAVAQVAGMGYSLLQIEQAGGVPAAASTFPPALPTIQMPSQPAAALNATTQMAPPEQAADLLKADAAKRMKLEADLTKMGMSPDEIRRLVNASAATSEGTASLLASPVSSKSAPMQAPGKSTRATSASLEAFAAQLNSANAAKSTAAVREVDLALPPFRESSTAETIQAEALLRDASMLRRKERFKEAEAKAREALALTPKDAGALELLGDILQGVGRVDESLAAYKRAKEADVKRMSAERKYGELLMRQQNWNMADPEAVAPNRWLNTIISLCLPGVGQLLNADWTKAGVFLVLDLVCAYMLFASPWAVVNKPVTHASPITLASFALTFAVYIAAILDSNISATRKLTA